ncbi:MAG: glycine betaine ABC transporter substrate-binding protein [Pyrinomonadaceae bacterium]
MSDFLQKNWLDFLIVCSEHLQLVLISTVVAIIIGIPLGIWITRRPSFKRPILAFANVMQTVPSLALFGLLIPLPFVGGIGAHTAIIALVLYGLLPIIRNTVTGIEGVDRAVREAAVAMGMTSAQILRQVELPLAAGVILAGVRVAAVISVGVATIAAAIGAGGLGIYIFRGLRQNDNTLILVGAIPAALIALLIDGSLSLLETRFDFASKKSGMKGRKNPGSRLRKFLAPASIALSLLVLATLFLFSAGRRSLSKWFNSSSANSSRARIIVGSKDFTEQVILGEIISQALEANGIAVERSFELGGNLVHDTLVSGQIDCYPEYTGTSLTAILKHQPLNDPRAVYDFVAHEYERRFSVITSPPLGFRNDFAILVRGEDARRLKLKTISDVVPYARKWRAGFGQDFVSRPDGYAGFIRAYDLKFQSAPREMDLALTYRALASREVDLIAGNSTDGLIPAHDLFQLEDDRKFFPPYEAVVLCRKQTLDMFPAARTAIENLGGKISTDEMRRMNYEVDGHKRAAAEVVSEWRRGG